MLKGSGNYSRWKIDLEAIMHERKLWGIVSGLEPKPEAPDPGLENQETSEEYQKALSVYEEKKEAYDDKDMSGWSLLIKTMKEGPRNMVGSSRSGCFIW